jgi:hypothetical protein
VKSLSADMLSRVLFTLRKISRRCLFAYRSPTGLTRVNGKGPKRYSSGEGGEAGGCCGRTGESTNCPVEDKVKVPSFIPLSILPKH